LHAPGAKTPGAESGISMNGGQITLLVVLVVVVVLILIAVFAMLPDIVRYRRLRTM
jgi:hypothetical protein